MKAFFQQCANFCAFIQLSRRRIVSFFKNPHMKHLLLKVLTIASLSFLASCDSDDDDMPAQQARVMVVHASPDAPAVDVRVNNAVAVAGLAYPMRTAYTNVAAGAANIKVAASGTTTNVIDANVNLAANTSYSVFAVNRLANIGAAVVMDNLATPAAGRAHVRFLHLSPDAPAVDIAVQGGSVLFPNRSFNDQNTMASLASFTPVDAGTYDLEVRAAGTTTAVLPLNDVVLQAGKIYTVFAKGLLGGTGAQALGAEVIVHN